MTDAQSPLVREIEEAARLSTRMVLTTKEWPRIRAALEAAHEMAELLDVACQSSDSKCSKYWTLDAVDALNIYRRAVGGSP